MMSSSGIKRNRITRTLIFLSVFLLILMSGLYAGIKSQNQKYSKALGSTEVTNLESGNGLVEGENRLRLGDLGTQWIDTSSSTPEQSDQTKAIGFGNELDDIFVSGHIAANKGKSGSYWQVGIPPYVSYDAKSSPTGYIATPGDGPYKDLIIKTYPREAESDIKISSRIKVSNTLRQAILDPMLTVTADLVIITKYISDTRARGKVSLAWPYGSVSRTEELELFGNTSRHMQQPLKLSSIGTDSYLQFEIYDLKHDNKFDGGSHLPESGYDYTNSGICMHIDDIIIEIKIEASDKLTYRETLNNFQDVEVTGIDRDEGCQKDFVKPGDYVYVSTNIRDDRYIYNLSYNAQTDTHYISYTSDSNVTYTYVNAFRDYYIKNQTDQGVPLGDTKNCSTIEWSYSTDYLERIIDDEFDITGQTAKFFVKQLEPNIITSLRFIPYLRAVNLNNPDDITMLTRIYSSNPYLTLRGDAAPPNDPEIINTDPFYTDNYLQKDWYSKGTIVFAPQRGIEIKVNMTGASFNHSQGSSLKVFYTTDNSNPVDSPSRQRLVQTPITNTTSTYVTLFFPLPGSITKEVFNLKFVTYDYVGNISSLIIYEEIKIDCTDYAINVYFMQGETESYDLANTPSVTKFGLAQLGTYVSEYDKNYTNTRNPATRSYRRGALAYIRLTFKKSSGFRLFQYYNSGIRNFVDSFIDYENFADFAPKNSSEVYFHVGGNEVEYAIEITDEMLLDLNSLNFYFFFKQQINILVGATETVYDGMPKGIEQPTTNFSGIDIVTYYKENEQDEFVSTDRFVDAGSYYYKCEIINNNYFGTKEGPFIINKANPVIVGLEVLDITYGSPMSSAVIRCANTDPSTPETLYNQNWSSDGKVFGNFRITYPVDTSISYQNPSQGMKDITVTFYPSTDFDHNYNSLPFQTSLYVQHSTFLNMEFVVSSLSYVYQKDVKRYASVTTNPPNQILIYEYKREGQPDSNYTTNEPVDAGIYEVRVRTNLELCNYDKTITTESTGLKMVINRQPLRVESTPAVAYYQNEFDPIAEAYLGDQYIPIGDWKYQYKINNTWVNTRPINAGFYETRVTINSMNEYGLIIGNYSGEAYTSLTIKKGNADSTTSFQIVYPQPRTVPSIYGHIAYGQKLSDIIMTTGSGYVAKYLFRYTDDQGIVYYDQKVVEGSFLITNRLYNQSTDPSIEAFKNEMNNKILPVGKYLSSSALYMTFVPEDLINFNVTASRVNITIVKGTPSFENLVVEELTFGDIASMLVIQGFEKQQGDKPIFTISQSENPEDLIYYPTVNGLPVPGKLTYIDRINKTLSAGNQFVTFSFLPDDQDNINTVPSFNMPVYVKKAVLELEVVERIDLGIDEFIVREYGNPFVNPTINIYKFIGDNRILDNSFNINYMYKDSVGQTVSMTSLSPSGQYSMRAVVVNNNYEGEIEDIVFVEKTTPIPYKPPQAGTVKYGMDMTNVLLTNGIMQHPKSLYTIAGTFDFDGQPRIPYSVGELEYDVVFYPNDANNYEQAYFTIKIRVEKAHAVISLSNLTHTYTGIAQNPSYTTNIVLRTDGVDESYVDLTESGQEFTEFDRYLNVELRYSTNNGSIPLNAGSYTVTARIIDSCFEGVYQQTYVINQANATIIVDEASKVQAFNGGTLNLNVRAVNQEGQTIGTVIRQSFKNHNNVDLQDAPRDVGFYTVRLNIMDANYVGTLNSDLTIKITQLSIHNTVQTYGNKPSIVVAYLPSTAISQVSYQKINDDNSLGDVTVMQPTNAGRYKININFPSILNNGYSETFNSQMIIHKAQVELSYNGTFEYSYIGENRTNLISHVNNIRVSPSPLYTIRRYIEFFDAQTETFTSVEPVDVGEYIMRVTLNDSNYAAQQEFSYVITKATPIIRLNPVIAPIIFTDDGSQAVIQGGEVIFNGIIKPGSYSIVENTMNLEVGMHNIRYCFMPEDSHNLKEVYGITQLIVHQKDLSNAIVFSGASIVEYNAQPHYITASIDSGESVIIDIFYNRSKSAPRERGTYTVTAEVVNKNYSGQAEWSKQLVIREGVPMIVAPKLTDITLGKTLSYSQIQGGYAYIKGTGEYVNGKLVEGTATVIPGTFAFINPNREMNQANYRTVQLSFTPFVSNNFSNIIFYTDIRVIGQNPSIGNVVATVQEEGQLVYYGQKTNSFRIFFENLPENYTEGVLSFVDEEFIPKVGGAVRYRFYPTQDTIYNIVEGEVSVDIQQAHADVVEVSAKAFYGQSLRQAVFHAVMTNRYNMNVEVDGNFELLSVAGFDDLDTILTVNNVTEWADIVGGTPVLHGIYRFTSDNYQTIEGELDILCLQNVNQKDISVGNLFKQYNALPISIAELDITTSFTEHSLYDENYVITILDKNGNISTGVNVGKYTVVIEIVDVIYYGQKTIEFEILKTDISSYLSISYDSAEFGSAIARPDVIVVWEDFGTINQSDFTLEFKKTTESISSYNETMPSQAGVYDVRLSVVNNPYFRGTKFLTFTIQKKVASVEVYGMIQNFGNVTPLNVISVEYDLVPTVTYYSSSYSRTTTVPTQAGDYIARVELINNNYRVSAGNNNYVEVSFRIQQALLTLITKPTVSDIVYGQKYDDSAITGGLIKYGNDITVQGKYVFINPNLRPGTGQQATSLVFVPYNKNFASLTINDVSINVLRANTEIIFTKVSAIYDGTNKKDQLKYLSDSNIEWDIVFKQNGVIVNPVNAGIYQISIAVLNPNYQLGVDIQGNSILEKENAATFIIHKASMESFSLPKPTSIVYGQSLAYSTLNIDEYNDYGMVKYQNVASYVSGEFAYINSGLVLGDSGKYIVDIIFNPMDFNNYNTFKTKVEVEVVSALATIIVSDNVFEYGTPISQPTFRTNPGNLSVEHDMDILGQIINCGVYQYRAWITTPNYSGEFIFNITIQKKQARLTFVQDNVVVEKYFTTYSKMLYAKAVANMDDVIPQDRSYINQNIFVTYYSIPKSDDIPVVDYGHIPPESIGDYRVVAQINDNNYYGTVSIYYDINIGEIEEIHFDKATLEQQVYGSGIKPPIITTKPSGVSYWIDYQGHGRVTPKDAGTYNIVVYFEDSNYAPRHISAMMKIQKKELKIENIAVQDKVYDGVPALEITARLNGVNPGDEVTLTMKARTEGSKKEVGRHKVEITNYSISGLNAKNYYLAKPYYAGSVEIFEKIVRDTSTQSYITSNNGFNPGVTVEFKEIESANNGESVISNMLGSKATVQSFIIKENGYAVTLKDRVKVYVKIPEEYLNVDPAKLSVATSGELTNQNIIPIREGDYYTFYADSSGEVIFSSNEFSYWVVGAIAVAVVFVFGIIFLFMLNPRHKRIKTADTKAMKQAINKIKKNEYR